MPPGARTYHRFPCPGRLPSSSSRPCGPMPPAPAPRRSGPATAPTLRPGEPVRGSCRVAPRIRADCPNRHPGLVTPTASARFDELNLVRDVAVFIASGPRFLSLGRPPLGTTHHGLSENTAHQGFSPRFVGATSGLRLVPALDAPECRAGPSGPQPDPRWPCLRGAQVKRAPGKCSRADCSTAPESTRRPCRSSPRTGTPGKRLAPSTDPPMWSAVRISSAPCLAADDLDLHLALRLSVRSWVAGHHARLHGHLGKNVRR